MKFLLGFELVRNVHVNHNTVFIQALWLQHLIQLTSNFKVNTR
jgi:hypothetical protein